MKLIWEKRNNSDVKYKELYFLGEFGYFNDIILGNIDLFVNNNSDKFGKLVLYTYPDFCKILNIMYPGFFILKECEITDEDRICFGHNKMHFDLVANKINLKDFFNINHHLFEIEHTNIRYYIKNKIELHNIDINNKVKEYKQSYIFFFRKRIEDPSRNFCTDKVNIDKLLNIINDNNNLIILYNANSECYVPEFINYTQTNIEICNNISDLITYFNVSDAFYSNDSGIVGFAKNCGCRQIYIFPNKDKDKDIWNGNFSFNPFNSQIDVFK